MTGEMRIRPATAKDTTEMVAVLFSAFEDNVVHKRCFPESDPRSHEHYVDAVRKYLADPTTHLWVAQDAEEAEASELNPALSPPPIAGWARWVRREADAPGTGEAPAPVVFTPDMFPTGDSEFAVHFFQRNHDVARGLVGDISHWHLSMLLVRKSFQRRGVGGQLMRLGLEGVDRDAWPAFVNGSAEGTPLYEKFGFRTVEVSDFDGNVRWNHMRREVNGGKP